MQKRDLYLDKYYFNEFKIYLEENQRANRTIYNYLDNIILFIEYFNQTEGMEFDPAIITQIDIADYISHSQNVQKLSASSINVRIQSLKSYYQYLFTERIVAIDPAAKIRKLKVSTFHEAKSFDDQTYRKIRRLIYRSMNPLHICMWEILTRAGLRVSELTDLTLDNVKMNLESDDIRTGKLSFYGKGKYREVPLHKDTRIAIIDWLKMREKMKVNSPYLLISERRNKFSRSGINRILKNYYAVLGIDGEYSVHSCRHYFCRALIRNGVDLSTVARLAGHSNAVITSQLYTLPNEQEMEDAINKL